MANLSNINNKFLVTTGGNVGINTTSPDSKLDVTGGDITVNATGTGFMNFKYSGSQMGTIGTDGIDLKITANADLQLLPTGNVGIGTSSPDAKLSLYHATDDVSINVNTGTGGSYPKKTGISFGAISTSLGGDSKFKGGAGIQAINTASSNNPTDLAFWTTSGGSPTERMRIDTNGRVGIGVTPNSWNTLTPLQIKNAALSGFGNSMYLTQNAYYDGAWKYIANSYASKIQADDGMTISVAATGTANNAISFIDAISITNTGNATFAGKVSLPDNQYLTWTTSNTRMIGNSDYLIFQVAATDKMAILSNGNVGIGTTSPTDYYTGADNLVVYQASGEAGITVATAANTTGALYFADGTTGDAEYRGGIFYNHNTDTFGLVSGGASRVTLDSSGNVSITGRYLSLTNSDYTYIQGTHTGAADGEYCMRVFGYGDSTFYGSLDILRHDTDDGEIRFRTRIAGTATDVMTIVDGNVGIGTTSPNSILHVGSTGSNAYSSTITKGSNMKGIINTLSSNVNDMVGIYFATGATTEGQHWSGITGSRTDYSSHWGTQLNFYTHNNDVANLNDATQKMVIKGDGKVGIGTTSPSSKLHIQHDNNNPLKLQNTTGIIVKTQFEDNASRQAEIALHTGSITFSNGTSGVTEKMRINSSGNVFIGSTTGYSPNLGGVVRLKSTYNANENSNLVIENANNGTSAASALVLGSYGADFTIRHTSAAAGGDLIFTRGTNERLRITSTGYIEQGIVGTTGNAYYYFNTSTSGDAGLIFRDNTSTNSGYVTYNHFENAMKFGANGSERMRINVNGNVNILNTTSTDSKHIGITNAAGTTGWTFGNGVIGNAHQFVIYDNTAGSPRMLINSSGNVGIGLTSPSDKLHVDGGTGANYAGHFVYGGTDGTKGCLKLRTVASTGPSFIDFFYDGFSTNPLSPVGAIVTTGTATSYASFSDYRMKQNVNDLTNVLDKVINLKPKTFNYKNVPDVEVQGFLAHELQEVIPQAVHGEKDEVHPDGNPKYQLVDHSHMIPLLTAAIKELKADNDSLKARIETLENK